MAVRKNTGHRARIEPRPVVVVTLEQHKQYNIEIQEKGGYWTGWIGPRADLIAAGACDEQHFPQSGEVLACGGNDDNRRGVKLWSTIPHPRGFQHLVFWTEEERALRQTAAAAIVKAQRSARRALGLDSRPN